MIPSEYSVALIIEHNVLRGLFVNLHSLLGANSVQQIRLTRARESGK